MTEYDTAQQEHALQEWERILHWNASIHGWIGKTDDFSIFVPEEVYKRSVRAYLASQGIEWKTYLEIMHPAEEAWKRQCDLEHAFRANLDQWLSSSEPHIQIIGKNGIVDIALLRISRCGNERTINGGACCHNGPPRLPQMQCRNVAVCT